MGENQMDTHSNAAIKDKDQQLRQKTLKRFCALSNSLDGATDHVQSEWFAKNVQLVESQAKNVDKMAKLEQYAKKYQRSQKSAELSAFVRELISNPAINHT